MKEIIKSSYFLNDITLAFHSHVIKTFLKSDIIVIWVNVWNFQNKTKAKGLINRYFNIRHYIATIWEININFRVFQYKNC